MIIYSPLYAKNGDVILDVYKRQLLEKMATDEQRSRGLDIADFLLMEDTPQMILQKMIELNPALQTFIDTFELELVDAGKME